MNIKTSSWHYRFINSFFDTVPRSLCPYFWKVVWGLMLVTGMVLLLLGASFSIGVSILEFFAVNIGLVAMISAPFVGVFAIAIAIIVLVFIAISWGEVKIKLRSISKKSSRSNEKKTPSLVVSYIKARKEKICPTLKFVD
ncbi:conserved hypothetical protein [Aeromonas phage 65]|uniref:Uncharacterized protein n=2 Tax=Ishigurovirus osborne TaxID=260149 RepID=E5DS23_9CAUD|nr:membrane protein [Aeromonas phage 65]ADQ53197.1 conserved hypothetical protein [Aeromonas phage 65]